MAVRSSERRLERTCEGTASAPLWLPSLWSELAEARDVEGAWPREPPTLANGRVEERRALLSMVVRRAERRAAWRRSRPRLGGAGGGC